MSFSVDFESRNISLLPKKRDESRLVLTPSVSISTGNAKRRGMRMRTQRYHPRTREERRRKAPGVRQWQRS